MIPSIWNDWIEEVQRLWKWFLALGIALVILGIVAVGASMAVTLTSVLLFGVLFITSGVIQTIQAFQTRQSNGFFLDLLAGIFDLVIGVLLVTHPTAGALALTLLLAAFFLVGGLFRSVTALFLRYPSWGLVALGRHRQPVPGHSAVDRMAGLCSLVHRHDLPRLGLGHAGAGGTSCWKH